MQIPIQIPAEYTMQDLELNYGLASVASRC